MSFKRILCTFLAALCVFTALPIAAFAYDHSATTALPTGEFASWKQTDARWKDIVIGVDPWTDKNGVAHTYETVDHAGCLITSIAILAASYGLKMSNGVTLNPGTFAQAIYDNGSRKYLDSRGGVQEWSKIEELIPGLIFVERVNLSEKNSFSNALSRTKTLLSDPDEEYAIIYQVNNKTHFVAVDCVNAKGTDVVIRDPGFSRTLLSECTSVDSLRIFRIDPAYLPQSVDPENSYLWRVLPDVTLRTRNGPGTSYDVIGGLSEGDEVAISETKDANGFTWGRFADGWCALRKTDNSEIYCEQIEFPVIYNANGGSGAPAKQRKLKGTTLTLSSRKPTRSGYVFLGWATKSSAIKASYLPGISYKKDEPLTLYAVWMKASNVYGYGIDVSQYQGSVDWEKVASDNITFALLRAGRSDGADAAFEQNYAAASANGLHLGTYYRSFATTEEQARAEAEGFLDLLSGKSFDFPLYLDLENDEQKALGKEKLTKVASAFLNVLREQGLTVGVYAAKDWFGSVLDVDSLGGKTAVWMSDRINGGTLSQDLSSSAGIYQYSETGKVSGIVGNVDRNICYIDFPSTVRNVIPDRSEKDPKPLEGTKLRFFGNVINGGAVYMKVSDWKAMFDGEISVLDRNGVLRDDGDPVRTGDSLVCGETVYTVSVRGDLNGDGLIDAMDYMMLKSVCLGITTELLPERFYAGCFYSDTPDAMDYFLLKAHCLQITDLYEV